MTVEQLIDVLQDFGTELTVLVDGKPDTEIVFNGKDLDIRGKA